MRSAVARWFAVETVVEPLEVRRLMANVAVFDNGIDIDVLPRVDLRPQFADGTDPSAQLLEEDLEFSGHDVETFDMFDPASVAAALRFKDRAVVCVAGDGDFLMNGQELATAAQYGADLLVILVDNASYGTIRMHQEREYPERISATELRNPDFAALARAYGGWAETVEATEEFGPALDEALKRKGIRLIHCKTDVEQISNATTISKLREKAKA